MKTSYCQKCYFNDNKKIFQDDCPLHKDDKIYPEKIYKEVDKIIGLVEKLDKKITKLYRESNFDCVCPQNFTAYNYNEGRLRNILYLLKEFKKEDGFKGL